MTQNRALRISLPRGWTHHVRSAVVHVISLAQFAAVYTRSWAVDSMNGRVRREAENDPLCEEVAQLREEGRIKDARMARIPAPRRPHDSPVERLEILQLRAARKWSLQQTADAFFVTPETIASWTKRLDEQGANALLQMPEPVNRFPDLVRYHNAGLSVTGWPSWSITFHAASKALRFSITSQTPSRYDSSWGAPCTSPARRHGT